MRHISTWSRSPMTRSVLCSAATLLWLSRITALLSSYCMYVCIRKFITRCYKRCVFSLLQNDVSVSVGSWSDNGKEFHSFGAAAKLHSPKVEVWQASTCNSPRAAERKWRRLVLAVTGTHSSWRYSGAVWWRYLKMIKQSLKTVLIATTMSVQPPTAMWRWSGYSVGLSNAKWRWWV